MYSLIRAILFTLQPETAHNVSLAALKTLYSLRLSQFAAPKIYTKSVSVFGLNFKNPVGLAAGLDKNGDYIDALGSLGFGSIEIGTVTPRPQSGNPSPRLFRLPAHKAIINRMGFNNKGVDHLVAKVKRSSYTGVLGINIGKNFDTPNENAADDYLHCLRKVYPHADYVAVNISSPNTKNLRDLQEGDALSSLLSKLMDEKQVLEKRIQRVVPLVVKIAPDLEDGQIVSIAKLLKSSGVDGVIATNTTVDKSSVSDSEHSPEAGGLSGAPLAVRAREVVSKLRAELGSDFPIIGVGGLMSVDDALQMTNAGANLLQIYTGFVYKGPALISECCKGFAEAK